MTEQYHENEDTIENIVSRFRSKKFLYLTEEDMAQEIRKICYEAIKSFDNTKGASVNTYLTRCVSNRLKNLKRDNYFRFTNPCIENKCYAYDTFTEGCIFSVAYQDVCKEKIDSDTKMQKQISATNYVSIDRISEDHSFFNEDYSETKIMSEEIRRVVVLNSGEKFGVVFDKLINGRKTGSDKAAVGYIQHITLQIVNGEKNAE